MHRATFTNYQVVFEYMTLMCNLSSNNETKLLITLQTEIISVSINIKYTKHTFSYVFFFVFRLMMIPEGSKHVTVAHTFCFITSLVFFIVYTVLYHGSKYNFFKLFSTDFIA